MLKYNRWRNTEIYTMANMIALSKLLLKHKSSMLVVSVNKAALDIEYDTSVYQQRRTMAIKQDPVARIISLLNKSPDYIKLKKSFTNFLVRRGDTSIYGATVIQLLQEFKNIVTSTTGGAELMPVEYMINVEKCFAKAGANPFVMGGMILHGMANLQLP